MKYSSRLLFAVVSIAVFSLSASSQIRQTHLYIDDGTGHFSILTAASGGGTLTMPSGTGTLLMTSGTFTSGVALQGGTPGTQEGGNWNISGAGILGSNLTVGGLINLSAAMTATTGIQSAGSTAFWAEGVRGNTFAGVSAGASITTAGATGFGFQALSSEANFGSANDAFGKGALKSLTLGSNNVAVGDGTLNNNTSPSFDVAIGSLAMNCSGALNPSNCVGVGYSALGNGNLAGGFNTGVGSNTLGTVTTGSDNTALGASADVNSATATNRTAIGYQASATANNTVQLGNASVTSVNTQTAYAINGTNVITSSALGAGITGSSLTSVGTLGSLSVTGLITSTSSAGITSGNVANAGKIVIYDAILGHFATINAPNATNAPVFNLPAEAGAGPFTLATTASAVVLTPSGAQTIQPTAATIVPLTIKGFASQSVDLQDWENSTSTVVASVDASGNLSTSGTITSRSTSGITSGGNSAAGALKISDGGGAAAFGTIGFTSSHFTFGGAYIDMGSQDINNAGDGQFNTVESRTGAVTIGNNTGAGPATGTKGLLVLDDGLSASSFQATLQPSTSMLSSQTFTLPAVGGTLATVGGAIQNGTTNQTPADFNITDARNTSSVATIENTGDDPSDLTPATALTLKADGGGTNGTHTALSLAASNGSLNYDVTGENWSVDNAGNLYAKGVISGQTASFGGPSTYLLIDGFGDLGTSGTLNANSQQNAGTVSTITNTGHAGGVIKAVALALQSTGAAGGAAGNAALTLHAANGAVNYDIYGDNWTVDASGNVSAGSIKDNGLGTDGVVTSTSGVLSSGTISLTNPSDVAAPGQGVLQSDGTTLGSGPIMLSDAHYIAVPSQGVLQSDGTTLGSGPIMLSDAHYISVPSQGILQSDNTSISSGPIMLSNSHYISVPSQGILQSDNTSISSGPIMLSNSHYISVPSQGILQSDNTSISSGPIMLSNSHYISVPSQGILQSDNTSISSGPIMLSNSHYISVPSQGILQSDNTSISSGPIMLSNSHYISVPSQGILQSDNTSISSGPLDLSSSSYVANVLGSTNGGTGVNNGSNTLTLSGGNFTFTTVAGSSVIVPASGTLATTGSIVVLSPASAQTIQPTADVVPFSIEGKSGQTAHLQDWENSTSTVVASVDASGNLSTSGTITLPSATPTIVFGTTGNDRTLNFNDGDGHTLASLIDNGLANQADFKVNAVNADYLNSATAGFISVGNTLDMVAHDIVLIDHLTSSNTDGVPAAGTSSGTVTGVSFSGTSSDLAGEVTFTTTAAVAGNFADVHYGNSYAAPSSTTVVIVTPANQATAAAFAAAGVGYFATPVSNTDFEIGFGGAVANGTYSFYYHVIGQ